MVRLLAALSTLAITAASASKHSSSSSSNRSVKYTCPHDSRQTAAMTFTEIQILIDGAECPEQDLGRFLKKSLDKALSSKIFVHNAQSNVCEVPKTPTSTDSELDAILELSHAQSDMMTMGDDMYTQQHNNNNHYIYSGGFKGLYCPHEKKATKRLRSRKTKSKELSDDDAINNKHHHHKGDKTKTSKKKKPKKPKCVTMEKKQSPETFKQGSNAVKKWTNGKIGPFGDNLSILGPYQKGESTNTTFTVHSGVDLAVFKFDFVEIGTWSDKDYLGITIGKEKFGLKEALKQTDKLKSGHTKGGVSWAVKSRTHTYQNAYQHRVVIHVPKQHFQKSNGSSSGNSVVPFGINMKGNSGGIDNLQFVSRTLCAKLPKQKKANAELVNEEEVEDKLSEYITKDIQNHFSSRCSHFDGAHVHVYSRERWEDANPTCDHPAVDTTNSKSMS